MQCSWKSLSSDSETVGLLGPCEEKLSRGGTAYDVALIGKGKAKREYLLISLSDKLCDSFLVGIRWRVW